MTEELKLLWQHYKTDNGAADPAVRERLILAYNPLVKFVAGRVGAGLPRSVEQGDLIGYGNFGLIDAIERFEPERGFKFETFAIPRIQGAILDELRALDWVPRSVRSKAKAIERAMTDLEALHGRSASDEEIASQLDISVDALHSQLSDVAFGGIAALDEVRSGGAGNTSTLRDLLADQGAQPGDRLEEVETRSMLGRFIGELGDREKAVLTLYYFEGLTMADIGDVFGVTESRVCQIHAKAVLGLRTKFAAAHR